MTRADRFLIGLVALAIVVSVPVAAGALGRMGMTAAVVGPEGKTSLDLRREGTYEVAGRTGVVTLRVADGSVRAILADCPDKVCVRSGIARPGRPIVCAPNGVSVSVAVDRGQGGNLDAVSR